MLRCSLLLLTAALLPGTGRAQAPPATWYLHAMTGH
jgi:hypothetical protein